MKIAFYGDSMTEGLPGASYFEVLKKRLPEHTLINYGKGGDTVLSLYRRILRFKLLEPLDVAFLWIGVNDLPLRLSWVTPYIKRLRRQPWTANPDEFRERYRALLDLLCPQANRVVTVSPLILGEDLSNASNVYLERLSSIVAEATSSCAHAEYLNLRDIFAAELNEMPIAGYMPNSIIRVALDVLILRTNEQIDRMAARRGLNLTLDGLHLNSRGAELVANAFIKFIKA